MRIEGMKEQKSYILYPGRSTSLETTIIYIAYLLQKEIPFLRGFQLKLNHFLLGCEHNYKYSRVPVSITNPNNINLTPD